MRQVGDQQLSLRLFFDAEVPEPAPTSPGALRRLCGLRTVLSRALDSCGRSREAIARRMSELLGHPVSKHNLDRYTAPTATTWNISVERAIALDIATDRYDVLRYYAEQCGARVYFGRDAQLADLGRAELLRAELSREIRLIKQTMAEA